MSRGLRAGVILVVLFAAAQLVRPARANPATDPARALPAHLDTTNGVVAILGRACYDCHSNETVWTRYSKVAPLSWVMAYAVRKGREAVNFSEWAEYTPGRQQQLLVRSCKDATEGKMPGRSYTLFYPEARLTASDVKMICETAH